MPVIAIPFTKGQSEAVDSKLLPNGLFSSLVNVRYRKDGRLGTRFGYDFDAGGSSFPGPASAYAAVSVADKENLIFGASTSAGPASANRHISTSPGYEVVGNAAYSTGADLGVPEIVQSLKQYYSNSAFAASELLSSTAYGSLDMMLSAFGSPNNLILAGAAYTTGTSNVTPSSGTGVSLHTTGQGDLSNLNSDTGTTNVKVVTIGGQDCVFWAQATTNNIRFARYQGATSTVVVAAAGRAPYFDVSPGGASTEAYLVYQSGANLLSFGTVSNLGVFTLLNTIATTNIEARASISPTFNAPTDQIAIVWNDGATFVTGDCRYTVYRRSTVSFIIASTTMSASNTVTNYPTVAPDPANDWTATFISKGTTFGTATLPEMNFFSSGATLGVYRTFSNVANVTKPFSAGTGMYVVAVDRDLHNAVDAASYYILRLNNFTQHLEFGFAYNIAKPADTISMLADPRRRVVTGITALGQDPGLSAVMFALPTRTSVVNGCNIYRMEYGTRAEMLSPGLLNGQVLLSGPRVLEYDKQTLVGSGFLATPQILAVSPGVGGLPAGTYQYVTVFEYFSREGFRHVSIPSLPANFITAGGAGAQVISSIPFLDWEKLVLVGVMARFYRTAVGGTVFYFVSAVPVTPAVPAGTAVITDNTTDAALVLNEILYTQGARGGLSGILQNDAPPPARYITAGSDRVLLGGMEIPSQVQWSKLRFDGEPLGFSNTPAFRANVDGRVTGVAEMDGIWHLFTRDTIWTVNGAGPDDSGAGSFSAPQRLPSDTGCISHKSIVKSGLGLLFQGITNRFFLLPRGGGACEEIGQVVRDTMLAFPYVSASAYNQEEQVAYWAVTDTTASAGRIVVYDTIRNVWAVDNFYGRAIKSLSIYDGKLVIDGSIVETAAYTDDDTGAKADAILPVWVTGDIRAFGANGWGRYRKVQLLGEARDVTVAWSLTLDVSYDSGKTFAETATWTRANLALAIGDAIDGAEHAFVTQKTDTVRLRGSITTPSPTEGLVFNELSLDVRPEGGLKRQPNALRAP